MQPLYNSLGENGRYYYSAIEALKLGWGGMMYIYQLIRMRSLHTLVRHYTDSPPCGGRQSAFETIED